MFDGTPVEFDVLGDGVQLLERQTFERVPFARFADHAGAPECPAGYVRQTAGTSKDHVICEMGKDEIVRVGTGPSVFWIDRYESSVWSNRDGSGTQHGFGDNYPATFPDSG